MKGMTMEFALMRIFELESKQDVTINRRMIDNYIKQLKQGFLKNRKEFLQINDLTLDQLRAIQAEKKFVDFVGKAEMKRFELTGQEKMLARILEAPMKSAKENNNVELQEKLQVIKNQLFAQPQLMPEIKQKVKGERTVKELMKETYQQSQQQKQANSKPERPRNMIDSMFEHLNQI